eukprot:UN21372
MICLYQPSHAAFPDLDHIFRTFCKGIEYFELFYFNFLSESSLEFANQAYRFWTSKIVQNQQKNLTQHYDFLH